MKQLYKNHDIHGWSQVDPKRKITKNQKSPVTKLFNLQIVKLKKFNQLENLQEKNEVRTQTNWVHHGHTPQKTATRSNYPSVQLIRCTP